MSRVDLLLAHQRDRGPVGTLIITARPTPRLSMSTASGARVQ